MSRSRSVGRLACVLLALVGCSAGTPPAGPEITGPEVARRLPEDFARLLPADAILCLDESKEDGAYRLWILRRPGGDRLTFPAMPKKRGLDHHELPPSALEGLLQSRLPALDRGDSAGRRCRSTHWKLADGSDLQIRELVTDRGWFAAVEQVRM